MTSCTKKSKSLFILLFIILPTHIIVHCVCLGAPFWRQTVYRQPGSSNHKIYDYGLFRYCYDVMDPSTISHECYDYVYHPSWLLIARGMMIASLVTLLITTLVCLLSVSCSCIRYPINTRAIGTLSFITAVLSTAGWSIFVGNMPKSSNDSLYACFGLAVVSTFFSLISSLIAFLAPRPNPIPLIKRNRVSDDPPPYPIVELEISRQRQQEVSGEVVIISPPSYDQIMFSNRQIQQEDQISTPV